MGGLFKGSNNLSNNPPIDFTMRIQTSIMGRPIPIGAGQNRYGGNLVCWFGFQTNNVKTPGSKGGGVGSVVGKGAGGGHTYNVNAIVSLGQAIAEVNTVYDGQAVGFLTTPSTAVAAQLTALGVALGTGAAPGLTFELGTYPQAPWSLLTASFPSLAIGYPGQALALFPDWALGSSAVFPSYNWEVTWELNSSPGCPTPDVWPDAWISAFLTDPDWGLQGFPAGLLGDLSNYSNYCQTYGLCISPVLTDQTAAQSHLEDIMKATAADFSWDQGHLTVKVYADLPGTGNGATFTPAVTPVYTLTSRDFLPNKGSLGQGASEQTSIAIERKNPSEAVNQLWLEYTPRGYLYNPLPILARDDAAILETGWTVSSDLRSYHFICDDHAAMQSAYLQLGRERVLCQYQFTLGAMYALLEIFDVVALVEPAQGLDHALVRIVEIQENDDYSLTFTAEDVPQTLGQVSFITQTPLSAANNALADPGAINTPIIFEPPRTLQPGVVGIAVSGVDLTLWGGCNVWVSTDGGTNYAQVGTINGPARQGVLTSTLPSVTPTIGGQTIDNTNTLNVDLSESGGALATATSAEMLALIPLCWVSGELISYENATLGSPFNYALQPLVRGAYGSPITGYSAGAPFVRLDSAIFYYAYSAGQVGSTIHLKFQSFNIYGQGLQDLSGLTAFAYTIAGSLSPRTDTYTQTSDTVSPTVQTFTTPFSGGPSGSPYAFVNIAWTPTPGDILVVYSSSNSYVEYSIENPSGTLVARGVTITVQGF